ncbi:MAG: DUF3303 family protein [Candidatus Bathyarchaeia archaeon]
MAKFFIHWEVDPARTPVDPEERAKLWLSMLEMTKADLQTGVLKDWGIRGGGGCGYGVSELSEAELFSALLKYIPYVRFEVHPVLTVDQCIETVKKVAQK